MRQWTASLTPGPLSRIPFFPSLTRKFNINMPKKKYVPGGRNGYFPWCPQEGGFIFLLPPMSPGQEQ